MSITFRIGRYIDPSGFGLAVVDVPELNPEDNISLIDYSHSWEENVCSSDTSLIKSYVDNGGHMPSMTVSDFLITNITTSSTNDNKVIPLFYRHRCRFYHFAYGQNPVNQVYITDQSGNILKNVNYVVKTLRIMEDVYVIDVITDFYNNQYSIYKVRYNRCNSDGSNVYPSWVETLNAEPLFKKGSPFNDNYSYSVWGPDSMGLYAAVVPPVPTLSSLVNSIGISFEHSPTIIDVDVTNNVSQYSEGVTVKYTLKATGPTTFTIRRNYDRYGTPSNYYLQDANTDTWGASPQNFNIGTNIRGIYGTSVYVHGDNYLQTNDEAYFTASRSYYYLRASAFSSIYLAKPTLSSVSDSWYIKVKNGRFTRRMDDAGYVVPSGQGTLWEYGIPEYDYQLWDITHGPPYKQSIGERVKLLDTNNIQLERTPMYIDASDVLYNIDYPGFPSSGYLSVFVNDDLVPPTGILDWDIYNGTVKLAQILSNRDDIVATYVYKEDFYEYTGFVGSGGIYPTNPPYPFFDLDLNPTPSHSYGVYASGMIASVFLRPYINMDTNTVICSESLYHNFTGTPSGVFDFKLGSISLGPNCRISDIVITDVRTRGGGLSQEAIQNLDVVKKVQPETEFFYDIGYFDGQAVPADGVLVVKVPKTVLKSNGGQFNEDEVKEKVKKHMALGEYAIVEFT